jgi:hypothetical protein
VPPKFEITRRDGHYARAHYLQLLGCQKLGVCGFGQPAAMLLNNHDRRKHRWLDRLRRAARSLRLVNPGSGYGRGPADPIKKGRAWRPKSRGGNTQGGYPLCRVRHREMLWQYCRHSRNLAQIARPAVWMIRRTTRIGFRMNARAIEFGRRRRSLDRRLQLDQRLDL